MTRSQKISQKSNKPPQKSCAWMVICSKFYTHSPQMLVANVQNVLARNLCTPEICRPLCSTKLWISKTPCINHKQNQTQFSVSYPPPHRRCGRRRCRRRRRLWSHRIRIWPIFYTDIHGRQRQNKQMRLSKWRRSQWRRAALTCKDMFRRLTIETKSFCFFPGRVCQCVV